MGVWMAITMVASSWGLMSHLTWDYAMSSRAILHPEKVSVKIYIDIHIVVWEADVPGVSMYCSRRDQPGVLVGKISTRPRKLAHLSASCLLDGCPATRSHDRQRRKTRVKMDHHFRLGWVLSFRASRDRCWAESWVLEWSIPCNHY